MLTLGGRLKLLRKQGGMKLTQVAAVAGVSASFLSQLENDKVGASFSTLMNLAKVYGVNLADLLEHVEGKGSTIVSHPDTRVTRLTGNHFSMEWLVNDPHCAMEVDILTIEPGGESGENYAHDGEEFAYVLTGTFTLTVGSEEHRLAPGDLLYFKSSQPHSWRNGGDTVTRVLFCTTPPTV